MGRDNADLCGKCLIRRKHRILWVQEKKASSHRGSGWEWVCMNKGGDSSEVSLEWYLGITRWMEAKMMVEGRWQRNVPDRWSHISKGSIIEYQLGRERSSGDGSEGPGPAYEGQLGLIIWSSTPVAHRWKTCSFAKAWWSCLFTATTKSSSGLIKDLLFMSEAKD